MIDLWAELGNPHRGLQLHLLLGHWNPEIFDKVMQHSCCTFGVILLHRVAHIIENSQFELSLHLGDGQFLVHSFFLCCH